MADITTMQAAVHTKLAAIAGRPATVWPNDATKTDLPRLEVFDGPVTERVLTLDGVTEVTFSLQVDVVVKPGGFSGEQQQIVALIAGAFAVGDTIIAGLEVSGIPTPQGYRQDGTEYRVSVSIPFVGIIEPAAAPYFAAGYMTDGYMENTP